MTARSDDPGVSPAAAAAAGGEIWGTAEDLLLACAVSRHGTASWDEVAKEVRSRCPSAAGFTPASCRLRFRVLHRRFSGAAAAENVDGGGGEEEVEEPDADAVASWVEELRKLRVAELRREVEKYDLSIGSLQSKLKRLTEEKERSPSGEAEPAVKEETEDDVRKGSPEEEEAGGVEDRVSGHESGRSCKESNSSDLKRPEDEPAAANDDPAEREEAAAGEVAVKEEASGESVAGSKEAEAEKESSDVQSSASPSRRRQRKGGGEEAEAASPSVSVPLPAAEAEPLVAFLESVRTSKAGAVFERRLDSQEGERYSGTIRRHVDLEMVRARLVGGAAAAAATCYASASELYRDLLLLCANALVFFPRGSPEHDAALQVRALVSKHISKDRPPAGKVPAAAVEAEAVASKKPKADADIAGSLLEKAPIIVCRKRSSIAKAAAATAAKGEKAETDKEKDGEDKKKAAVAATVTSKDRKARGMRTNKSRGPARNQKTKVSESGEGTKKSDKKGGGGGSSAAAAAAGGVAKKRNAVDFLNRMNQNGSPSTERVSLLETLKLSAATEQQKKSSSSSGKGDGRKDAGGSGSKKAAAASTPPGRRNVGRPPKRAAAPPTPPPSKRAKDDKPATRKRGKK
ncbi:uncharacterized abhydrolase domain-containing protein DDB_G0269086-like [Oryza brachyantha]|uniref:uncharacterized abhydrolase domain-containing protein DDB_G0269086-like n=1 Tax=Oryza brachyantha TaxID=4533 RepID=UPI001AD9ABFE|nr:uncharacterized abhydrolase domain-containing protein DDB_G0269086-like [Oryza brachyantha]